MKRFHNFEDEIWEEINDTDGGGKESDGMELSREDNVNRQPDDPVTKDIFVEEHFIEEGEEVEFVDNIEVKVELENGESQGYEIVGRMEIDGNSYLILYALDNNEEHEVRIEKFTADENDDFVFLPFESQEEMQLVLEEYHKLMQDDEDAAEDGEVELAWKKD